MSQIFQQYSFPLAFPAKSSQVLWTYILGGFMTPSRGRLFCCIIVCRPLFTRAHSGYVLHTEPWIRFVWACFTLVQCVTDKSCLKRNFKKFYLQVIYIYILHWLIDCNRTIFLKFDTCRSSSSLCSTYPWPTVLWNTVQLPLLYLTVRVCAEWKENPVSIILSLYLINYRYCFAELSPVCAVVGGVLGQEIIKVEVY